MPQNINDAVTKDFPGVAISELFNNDAKKHQLIWLTEILDVSQCVYFNEKGKKVVTNKL